MLEFVPGQKVCYVTDTGWTAENRERVIPFVANADLLFIEAVFLEADRALAASKSHLTTMQAGTRSRDWPQSSKRIHFISRRVITMTKRPSAPSS